MISNSHREEPSISIKEFERMLATGESFFFEIDTYEHLLEHYHQIRQIITSSFEDNFSNRYYILK